MSFDTALAGSGIVAASISGDGRGRDLRGVPDKTLDDVQKALDCGNPHVAGFALPDVTVTVHADGRAREADRPQRRRATCRRRRRRPASPSRGSRSARTTITSAAASTATRSRARTTPARFTTAPTTTRRARRRCWPSATTLARQPRRRNVLLAFWSGEELGLIGSSAFVADAAGAARSARRVPQLRHGRPHAGQQADRAGDRHEPGVGASCIEQANVAAGFDLRAAGRSVSADRRRQLQPGERAVPDLLHRHARRLPQADATRPTRSTTRISIASSTSPRRSSRRVDGRRPRRRQFTKVEQQTQSGGGRAGVRVFTGTIPDYATEVKGLLLGGVIGGGPAEQAGLQKGDVIVEIAGQTIANIYDYTYALELLKIGQPAKVVYMRGGERRETTLTPAARK